MPTNSGNCIKLPLCDIEVFEGSYEQWSFFRDMFTAVYINHSKLPTSLYHLRNKTRGEADAIVKRYPLSHDNFQLAWNALQTRFENKSVIVDNQIKILFDITAADSEDSESIRRIQSSVNDSCNSRNSGCPGRKLGSNTCSVNINQTSQFNPSSLGPIPHISS